VALAPRKLDFFHHLQALSRQFPPELARAALEIATLRGEPASRFPRAD